VKAQYRQEERIEQIFEIAMELFIERGYDNTPLSLIAKKAGLSKAGLYHHFENKEHLLFSIHQQKIESSLLPVLEKAEQEQDPEKRLLMFLRHYITIMTQDQSTQLLIHEAKRLLPEHYQQILKIWRRVLRVLTSTITELKNEGKVSQSLNDSFAAFAAIGMCIWTTYWFDKSRPESTEEVVDTLTHIFLSGIMDRQLPQVRENVKTPAAS
jgi:AcrR family transcriptional regulator